MAPKVNTTKLVAPSFLEVNPVRVPLWEDSFFQAYC